MQQVFAHNRNEISAFAAELVFCEVPGEFLQWGLDGEGVGVGIGGGVALIDAVGGGVAGVSPPPVCLCFLAADGLALGLAAGALAVADSWVRIEPPQTIPAGALPQSGHPLLSARLSGGQLFVGRGGQVFASAEGTRTLAYRAVDNYVYQSVRNFLTRRHKVSSRGTRRFSEEVVFGVLGVKRLRVLHLGPLP